MRLTNALGLRAIIDQVDYARSGDSTREALTGILLEPDLNGEAVVAVATDGHRLAMSRLHERLPLPAAGVLLLPESIAALKKTLHKKSRGGAVAEMEVDGGDLVLTRPGAPEARIPLKAKADDGAELTFPNWRMVVPEPPPRSVVVMAGDLADLVEPLGEVRPNGMVKLEGGVTAKGAEQVELYSELPLPEGRGSIKGAATLKASEAKGFGTGQTQAFYVKGGYLADALRQVGGSARVSFPKLDGVHLGPIRVTGPKSDDLAVVMPMGTGRGDNPWGVAS